MTGSTAPANQVVITYRRYGKRARTAGITEPPRAHSGSPVADSNWRDWTDSQIAEPMGQIAERFLADDVADYLRFRAVCSSWRLCTTTTSPRKHGRLDRRFHPRRWIMIPPAVSAVRKPRDFLNVSTGERITVDLPEIRDQRVLGPTSDGLILFTHRHTYAVSLLNPLTRQLTGLPNATTVRERDMPSRSGLNNMAVSGAGLVDDSTVALYLGWSSLVTAKPGDERWTPWHCKDGEAIIAALAFASRFYCVTEKGIMVVDATAEQMPPQLTLAAELGDLRFRFFDKNVNLVDNAGELLLVHAARPGLDQPSRGGYLVHRVDLDAGNIVPMQELGGNAWFVGNGYQVQGPVVSVPARLSPHVRADTIYSCSDDDGKLDRPIIDAYHVESGDMERITGEARSCSVVDHISRYVCRRALVCFVILILCSQPMVCI